MKKSELALECLKLSASLPQMRRQDILEFGLELLNWVEFQGQGDMPPLSPLKVPAEKRRRRPAKNTKLVIKSGKTVI